MVSTEGEAYQITAVVLGHVTLHFSRYSAVDIYVPCLTHFISGKMIFCNGKSCKHIKTPMRLHGTGLGNGYGWVIFLIRFSYCALESA